MNMVSVGVAFVLVVFLGNAISGGYTRGDDQAQYEGANQMLLAESGDNPWARPQQRQGTGGLPSYITNPKYATKEDVETKLNNGNKQRSSIPQQPQQQFQPGYGAPLGLPAVPHIYAPYYQPGYPAYPGAGMMPGLGTPYGGTGFGGNPLITPYGNIYGNVMPYQETQPSSDD